MKKNLFTTVLLPLILILAIVIVIFVVRPSADPLANDPGASDIAASDDGSAEVLDFVNALAEGRYTHAAQYLNEACEDNCLFEGADPSEYPRLLAEACNTRLCERVIIDEVDERDSLVRNHRMLVVDENDEPKRYCLDEACNIQKNQFIIRVELVDETWYVYDMPPVSPGFAS